mgnify:CR=1 FL=1
MINKYMSDNPKQQPEEEVKQVEDKRLFNFVIKPFVPKQSPAVEFKVNNSVSYSSLNSRDKSYEDDVGQNVVV